MTTSTPIRVLVTHGEPFTQAGLTAALSGFPDFELVPTDRGARGPQVAAEVAVTDHATGIELAARASPQPGARRTKVIIVSTRDRECEIRQALALGVCGYIVSGDSIEELASSVRAASRGMRHLSPQVAHHLVESITRERLTVREEQVLRLLVDGLCNKAIANRLDIAAGTVKSHLKGIFDKLGVTSRAQAIVAVERRGLLSVLQ